MTFQKILGQESAIALLQKAIQTHRLTSSYLFVGPHHTGKQKTAIAFAQAINCTNINKEINPIDACQACPSCLQIANQAFPDFSIIKPDGQFVKISQIKEAVKWLHIRPSHGNHRILIIDCAEQMNKESANAFLKTLEEPPQQIIIILLAEQTQQLLETIVSRCQIIRFQFLKKKHVETILSLHPDLSKEQIVFLTNHALGQVLTNWIENVEMLLPMRDKVQNLFMDLSTKSMDQVFDLIDEIGGKKDEKWGYMLDFLEYWIRDLKWTFLKLNEQQYINNDQSEKLKLGLRSVHPEQIENAFQKILQTRENISFNARAPLALSSLWIDLKQSLMV